MEDTRQDGSSSDPAGFAPDETPNADDPVDTQPDGGDVPAGEDPASEEGSDDDLSDPLETDPEGDEPEGEEKMIPYSRFRGVIEQRNDARDQNSLLKTLLQQKGVSLDGTKPTDTEKKQATADLSNYTPKQVEEAKALLHTVLKEELGLVGSVNEQLQQLKSERERDRREQAAKEDESQMESAMKEVKGEFAKKDIEAQILRWEETGKPQLQALARAPYSVILREMQRMKQDRLKKKPSPAPKVPASGGSSGGSDRLPRPSSGDKRPRPDPMDPTGWQDRLISEAAKRMKDESGE